MRGSWLTRGLPVAFSMAAAAIHFAAAPAHVTEFPPYGLAFVALAWFQAAWALRFVVDPSVGLAAIAIAVNAGAVGVWAVSRASGLPFGPEAGVPEPIGLADALATSFEIGVVVLLLPGIRRPRPVPTGLSAPASLTGVLLAVALISSVGLATQPAHHGELEEHGRAHAAPTQPVANDSSAEASVPGSPSPSVQTSIVAPIEPSGTPAGAVAAPSRPPASPSGPRPVLIEFSTRLDAGGVMHERGDTFGLTQVVVWKADLGEAVGNDEIRFQVLERRTDGRDVLHWDEPFAPGDPAATEIVAASALGLFAHDGPGTYVIRYVRGSVTVAEGVVTLTLP